LNGAAGQRDVHERAVRLDARDGNCLDAIERNALAAQERERAASLAVLQAIGVHGDEVTVADATAT
jgi:hypothetical protein